MEKDERLELNEVDLDEDIYDSGDFFPTREVAFRRLADLADSGIFSEDVERLLWDISHCIISETEGMSLWGSAISDQLKYLELTSEEHDEDLTEEEEQFLLDYEMDRSLESYIDELFEDLEASAGDIGDEDTYEEGFVKIDNR